MEFKALFTTLLAIATVLGNVLAFLFLLAFLFARPIFRRMMYLVGAHGFVIGALLSAGATIGSLVYSEVVGYAACVLCWIQRGFMYPQMFLLSWGTWKPSRAIALSSLVLTVLGGAVALYNWVKDMLNVYAHYSVPCPAVSSLPSCDRIYVMEYGYVTIAMIALNIFILLGITLVAVVRKDQYSDTQASALVS